MREFASRCSKPSPTHDSLSVQQTLYAMGETVLDGFPEVEKITLTMPNKHRILADLKPFGLDNANEIFVATDEPYGSITGTLSRETSTGLLTGRRPRLDSRASVRASTSTPRARSAGSTDSSGRWLIPPLQGMKIIPTGATRAMKSES